MLYASTSEDWQLLVWIGALGHRPSFGEVPISLKVSEFVQVAYVLPKLPIEAGVAKLGNQTWTSNSLSVPCRSGRVLHSF